jgi:thiamine-phosphate pyrophosphorylase
VRESILHGIQIKPIGETRNMNPYIQAQTSALVEGIRLLEVLITAPLGLYSDIKMMRESLSFQESGDLTREQSSERRQAHAKLTDDHQTLALGVIESVRATVGTLGAVRDGDGPMLDESWLRRASLVLGRAEQQAGSNLRARLAEKLTGIYVIVDPEATQGRSVEFMTRATLEGGAKVIQLRDKQSDKGQQLELANLLKGMCDEYDALFFMNDATDVARASNAHGLHIGQTDLPTDQARKLLTPDQLIGRSNSGLDQALESQVQGVDYVAVGAVYATSTMGKSGRSATGPEELARVKEAVPLPLIAIGHIGKSNITDVIKAGTDCVCIVSAITYSDDPQSATRELVQLFEDASG